MQLKQESLVIMFIFTIVRRIFFKSASSKEIIMLTFDNVKGGPLISNQLFELSVSETMFRASVKQSEREVEAIKPSLEVLPVLLGINEQTIRVYLLRWRNNNLR